MRLTTDSEIFPYANLAAPPATRRLKLGALLFALAAVCLCVFAGCARVAAGTPPTAPTDPYAKALTALNVFALALQDAQTTALVLNATPMAKDDGTVAPILSDAALARVKVALKLFASEGTALSGMLASRASAATISIQMAALTANLSTQLSPEAVGITDAASKTKYIIVTSILSAASTTLAVAVSQIPATEALHDRSRNPRAHSVTVGARSHDSDRHRSDSVGRPSFEAGRSFDASGSGERQFHEGAWLLT